MAYGASDTNDHMPPGWLRVVAREVMLNKVLEKDCLWPKLWGRTKECENEKKKSVVKIRTVVPGSSRYKYH